MATIARATGVSQGAISSLLNDRDYGIRVSEQTRNRVFRVCRELGYVPNDLRAFVRMYPELGDVAILWCKEGESLLTACYGARIMKGAREAMPDEPWQITIATYDTEADYDNGEVPLPKPLISGIASKVLCVGCPNPSLSRILQRRNLAQILIDGADIGENVLSIYPDYAAAARLAIEHLYSLGHRRIAVFGGAIKHELRAKLLGDSVEESLSRLEMTCAPQSPGRPVLAFEDAEEAARGLCLSKQLPTAIFCYTDAAAAGAILGLRSSGVRVPEDVSIVGCGDDPLSVRTYPPLTTVRLPVEDLGRRGIEEAVHRAHPQVERKGGHLILPIALVERGSTAAAPR